MFCTDQDTADSPAPPPPVGTPRALLIGIDHYPNLEPGYQLSGCANDVTALRQVLVDTYGFPPANVRTLLNEDAKRDAILDALDRLAHETEAGDIVVIQFSGHGSQVIDREG